jgi:hypothetical protein
MANSNALLYTLIVVAIVISVGGTMVVLDRMQTSISGMQVFDSAFGTVDITQEGAVSVYFEPGQDATNLNGYVLLGNEDCGSAADYMSTDDLVALACWSDDYTATFNGMVYSYEANTLTQHTVTASVNADQLIGGGPTANGPYIGARSTGGVCGTNNEIELTTVEAVIADDCPFDPLLPITNTMEYDVSIPYDFDPTAGATVTITVAEKL